MNTKALRSQIWTGTLILMTLAVASASAQMVTVTEEKYVQPPKEIADMVTAPRHLNVTLDNLGPDRESFVNIQGAGLATLAEFSRPFVNLGETALDFKANRARQFVLRKSVALRVLNYQSGAKLEIAAPQGMWLSSPVWSPDGSRIAYFVHSDDATHLYVVGLKDGKPRKITQTAVLATLVTVPEWTSDGKGILTILLPGNRKPMPAPYEGDEEPLVRVTGDKPAATRTYRFLMKTPNDKELFEWLSAGQLALIDAATGQSRNIGEPGMYKSIDVSPDGKYFRAVTILKPFSYLVPVSNFGTLDAVYDFDGKKVADIQKLELRENMVTRGGGPGGRDEAGRPDDRRSIAWLPNGQGLSFLQLEPRPKKDDKTGEEAPAEPGSGAKRKDRLYHWLPPFTSESLKMVFENEERIGSIRHTQDCQTSFMTETKDGEEHLFAVKAGDWKTKHTLYKHKTSDNLLDPGTLMTRCILGCAAETRRGPFGGGDDGGVSVVRVSSDGQSVFLSGTEYFKSPEEKAPHPFISKVQIMTGESRRIFEGADDVSESILTAADDDMNVIFTTRETATTVPDSYVRDLRSGSLRKLTGNVDYAAPITRAVKKRFQVERVDGIKFWVNLTLPADYIQGTRLPAMFWFYPREYTDQKDYDKSVARYDKNSFPNVGTRTMSILVVRGYAVVEPDCPIIGPQGQMNNNYVPDLRNNLWAVIDNLDKMGYIDRDRLGIGGHSYGAFSTSNALVHTPFFKAGIAGDGNYNRTLTPLTFQSERRWIYDAREVYLNMSPFLYANQMNGALLMYHGMDDANNGTDPINSERLFQVLNALGKRAVLFQYPYEDHGPAMKETLLDLWARWDMWLDMYVKNPKKDAGKAKVTQGSEIK